MIRFHVSAALSVRDAFTGKPLAQNAIQCFLDGERYLPQYKPGGYFVFVNLPEGAHRVVLRGPYYQDEIVEFTATESGLQELPVLMKPEESYPGGGSMVRLQGVLERKGQPLGAERLYIAEQSLTREIKLAQDQAAAGETTLRLFYRGGSEGIATPGAYLLKDGKSSEILLLKAIEGEMGILLEPLQHDHKRGKGIYPATAYLTNAEGKFMAFFREAQKVAVFYAPKRHIEEFALEQAENTITLDVS